MSVSVLVLRFCALKLIFKIISDKECIADCAPSFELVCRRKNSPGYFYGDCCRKNSRRVYRLGTGTAAELRLALTITLTLTNTGFAVLTLLPGYTRRSSDPRTQVALS